MTFLIISFILGITNIFISGMNCSMLITRKSDGKILDYKDYLSVILPVSVGIYLLVDMAFKITLAR